MLSKPASIYQQIVQSNTTGKLVILLITMFPLLSLSVRHWLSGIFSLLVITALVHVFRKSPKLHKEEKILLTLLVLYILSFVISATLNDWSDNSIRRIGNVLKYVFFIPLYILSRQYTDLSRYLLTGIITGGYVLGLQALYDVYITGKTQGWGIYGSIIFGDLSVLYFAVALILLIFNRKLSASTYILLGSLIFSLLAGFLSGSRNAWLAAVFSIFVIPFLSFAYVKYKKMLLSLPFILLLVSSFAFLLNSEMQHRLTLAINQVNSFITEGAPHNEPLLSSSAGTRLEQWRVALNIYRDAPFFGYGGGNAGKQVTRQAEKGLAHPDLINPDTAKGIGGLHSTYFESLVNEGIIGLLIILAFLAYPLWLFISSRNLNPLISTLGIILITNYMIFGITENPFVHDNFTSVYLLFLAVFFSEIVRDKYSKSSA